MLLQLSSDVTWDSSEMATHVSVRAQEDETQRVTYKVQMVPGLPCKAHSILCQMLLQWRKNSSRSIIIWDIATNVVALYLIYQAPTIKANFSSTAWLFDKVGLYELNIHSQTGLHCMLYIATQE